MLENSRQYPDPATDSDVIELCGEALAAEAATARRTAARRRQTANRLRDDAEALRVRSESALDGARSGAGQPTMSTAPGPEADAPFVLFLEEDAELAELLPEPQRQRAASLLRARIVEAGPGSWRPVGLDGASGWGLLVLDGIMAHRVRLADTTTMELLGPGDILRPGEDSHPADGLAVPAEWEILQPARLAILDERITAVAARWPQLSAALSSRLLRRTQRLIYLLAVSHLSRLEDRLLATLWCLAAAWGRVSPQGLIVPVRLTHQALGELAGAQRSSVSIAMGLLRERQAVTCSRDGSYIVRDAPPGLQSPLFDHPAPPLAIDPGQS